MRFAKYHALGNDYLVLEPKDCPTLFSPEAIRKVCHRHFGLGSDGIRDAWSPMGNGDMLERAMLLAFRFDLNKDEELAAAFAAATINGAQALGRKGYGVALGQAADFLLINVQTLGEAVVARPPRQVYRGGRLIAANGQLLDSRL